MATLASIQRLKPIFFFGSAITIVLLLIILIFLRYTAFETQKLPQQNQANLAFGNLPYPEFIPKTIQHKVKTITVSLKVLPKANENNSGNVYELSLESNSTSKAQQLASVLGFSGNAEVDPKFMKWSEGQKTLTFDTTTNRINFSNSFNSDTERTISTPQDAEVKARNFLAQTSLLPLNTQTKITSLKTLALNFVSATDANSADAYEIDFYETLDNLIILGQSPKTGTVTAIVDKAGNLIKLSTRLYTLNLDNVGRYPLRNIQQASIDVKTEGVVVEVDIPDVDPLIGEVFDINNINLTEYQLTYFISISENYMLPIYVFEGDLTLVDGRKGKATVYLPAIEKQYLKN